MSQDSTSARIYDTANAQPAAPKLANADAHIELTFPRAMPEEERLEHEAAALFAYRRWARVHGDPRCHYSAETVTQEHDGDQADVEVHVELAHMVCDDLCDQSELSCGHLRGLWSAVRRAIVDAVGPVQYLPPSRSATSAIASECVDAVLRLEAEQKALEQSDQQATAPEAPRFDIR